MHFSTFLYCVKQGFINIMRNILFSLASIATVAACIFLFCLFFSIIRNVQNLVYEAETTVGITVFFTEDADQSAKDQLKQEIEQKGGVKEIRYISADEAWNSFKQDYFGDAAEELSAAFANDNPLATSDSYEIFMNKVEDQQSMVSYIKTLPYVREVRYANAAVSALKSMNHIVSALSAVIIGVLFAVSVFLISNTISVAAAFRKRENEIMKLIGATNFMIRAPFVVEGVMIGLAGALIPLAGMFALYRKASVYLLQQMAQLGGAGASKELFRLIPLHTIFPTMTACGMGLGVGIGFFVSFFTIRRHLKV